ncbi:Mov34/MPN/PAD-1 family protein [Piscibacillus halophilus]|uniref:Proteasome lid subunit RPN8/RPN11, contains Jab1/MPN metalloenzyme (JAMM) motif n=1 Tax=Piscibacillus halophilus TaxID=571933 RepID=A0A1H9HF47_9BACI|nr:M67 family metallopeptidase [Piscibacillus halophilus]SEQ60935.1 Proteasome lid subunit RPN8/RPN11, contains Jab1/MPN metalloenzyme (JAMM) motif [Piscibacillus halophilus]
MTHADPITIKRHVLNEMIEHATYSLPSEGCGLLIGQKRKIQTFLPLINESKDENQFKITSKQLERVLSAVSFINQEVVAIYHSHPSTRAVPSSLDLRNHMDTDVKMIIVSLKHLKPTVKCYEILNHLDYKECPLIIDNGSGKEVNENGKKV